MSETYCVIQTLHGVPKKLVVITKYTDSLISRPIDNFKLIDNIPADNKYWPDNVIFSFDVAIKIKNITDGNSYLDTFIIPTSFIFNYV